MSEEAAIPNGEFLGMDDRSASAALIIAPVAEQETGELMRRLIREAGWQCLGKRPRGFGAGRCGRWRPVFTARHGGGPGSGWCGRGPRLTMACDWQLSWRPLVVRSPQ